MTRCSPSPSAPARAVSRPSHRSRARCAAGRATTGVAAGALALISAMWLAACGGGDPRGVLFSGQSDTEGGTEILVSESFDVPAEGRLVVKVTVQRGAAVNVALLEKAPYRSNAVSPRVADGAGTQVILESRVTERRYELLITPTDRPLTHRVEYEVELK